MKQKVKRTIENLARLGEEANSRSRRRGSNVELTLSVIAGEHLGRADVADPTAWIDFLRDCFEPQQYKIDLLSTGSSGVKSADLRFHSLLDALRTRVPVIPTDDALMLATLADAPLRDRSPFEGDRWAGDAGLHASMASSNGRKGRLVATVVRVMRPKHVLELGTAYAVGASFILATLARLGDEIASFTTVEGMDPQYTIASRLLAKYFPRAKVRPIKCDIRELAPQLAADPSPDVVFHDATHTADAYERDFAMIEPMLKPGSVFLLDDINWQDARFVSGDAQTHEGWRRVASHRRIAAAAEIDSSLGILLLK